MTAQMHEHYEHYSPEMVHRLDGFYGRVDARMNERISEQVVGKSVLDLGCGFGQLVDLLRAQEKMAVGIDQLKEFIDMGRIRYPLADLRCENFIDFSKKASLFDTVLIKDTFHHIFSETDIDQFWQGIERVCRKRLIIFDPNPTWFLFLARRFLRHTDPICTPAQAKTSISKASFHVVSETYSDLLAFPLSGGYISQPFVRGNWLGSIILEIDELLEKLIGFLHLGKYFCWRYLLVADKID